MELTITKVGDALGVVLPEDFLARLQLKDGDTVYAVDVPDGMKILSRDSDFEEAMAHAERVMRDHDNALRRLAE